MKMPTLLESAKQARALAKKWRADAAAHSDPETAKWYRAESVKMDTNAEKMEQVAALNAEAAALNSKVSE